MNSLFQCLSGSPIFLDYIEKIFNLIKLDTNDRDSIITISVINIVRQLSLGSNESCPEDVYKYLCDEFTAMFEE